MATLGREDLLAQLKRVYEALRGYRAAVLDTNRQKYSDPMTAGRQLVEDFNAVLGGRIETDEDVEELRQALVRDLAPLRPIVQTLTGRESRFIQMGSVVDAWGEGLRRHMGMFTPGVLFSTSLDQIIDDVNAAIGILETEFSTDLITLRRLAHAKPLVLICHGGETTIRKDLELFLWKSAGVDPIVVEDVSYADKNPDQKVDEAIADADFAIVLVEKSRTSSQDGKLLPRGNVIDEIERLRLRLSGRFLILLEEGVTLPTNLSTAVTWVSFSSESFDTALLKVIQYLRQHEVI